jgi:hypothetical protein
MKRRILLTYDVLKGPLTVALYVRAQRLRSCEACDSAVEYDSPKRRIFSPVPGEAIFSLSGPYHHQVRR